VRVPSLLFASALALLVARAALAQPAGDVNTARRLFQEATALEQSSDWEKASEKLDAALAIKETPGLHFHRAHCAEQLGKLVLAARHYARSDELIRAGATAPDVEELLTPARARLLARVPRLTLTLPSDVVGATLEIDGAPVSDPPGTPILLDPGKHRIVARAPDRRDFETEIALVEGQTRTLEVAPTALRWTPVPAAPQERKPEEDTSGWGARELVLVGEATLTVVGLGVGIGFSIAKGAASDRYAEAQARIDDESATEDFSGCSGETPAPSCADLDPASADHDQASRYATIGFVTAGVGAAATLVTWALWPSERASVTASVLRNPGGATLSLRGRF
jgi:hypothetical protein